MPFEINGKVITSMEQMDQLTMEEKRAFAKWSREQGRKQILEEGGIWEPTGWEKLFRKKPEESAPTDTENG